TICRSMPRLAVLLLDKGMRAIAPRNGPVPLFLPEDKGNDRRVRRRHLLHAHIPNGRPAQDLRAEMQSMHADILQIHRVPKTADTRPLRAVDQVDSYTRVAHWKPKIRIVPKK